MPNRKIVLDLETQKELAEVGGKQNLTDLKVSMVGVYDYETDEYRAYEEHELPELEALLRQTKTIIGFNTVGFDLPVLEPYLSDLATGSFNHIDIMVEMQKVIGHRASLDRVAGATLGTQKTGHGLDAIKYYRSGEIDKLKKYCLDDVKLTKKIYDYATANGHLKFRGAWGTYEVPVNFA